jgi:hypothetical protein
MFATAYMKVVCCNQCHSHEGLVQQRVDTFIVEVKVLLLAGYMHIGPAVMGAGHADLPIAAQPRHLVVRHELSSQHDQFLLRRPHPFLPLLR